MVRGLPTIEHVEQFCDGCALGKQHRLLFPPAATYRAECALELVHTDLCGPITPTTPGRSRYFLLVVDDHSRYMWVEMLRTKDEAFARFKKVKAAAEAQGECRLLAFRSDRGGEFNSGAFKLYCAESGIRHQTTAPYTPQQNGVVERRNQTVVEMARCLLKAMGVPNTFWGEAVRTAVYILNRSPTRSLNGVTPYEAWHGKKASVHHFRTFGCVAHVKRLGPGVDKLADRSTPMVLIGYEEGAKAYRVYDPAAKKVQVTRDVIFEEGRPWDWKSTPETVAAAPLSNTFVVVYNIAPGETVVDAGVTSGPATEPPRTPAAAPPEPATPTVETQHKWATPPTHDETRDASSGPRRYRYMENLLEELDEEGAQRAELCMLAAEEPASVDEALADEAWKEAMDEEMRSITDNNTWELTTLPAGHRAIGLKWVFKVKRDASGAIIRHKARLVAKGYAQRQGVDFDEVFAPVARMETVRLLLALAAHSGWKVHHMDVKSAFLNGDLEEEVYVHQPAGYIDGDSPSKVLKLRKALYGLRQAPRAWNAKLDETLTKLGFRRCPLEHALYRRGDSENYLLVGVYVDDLVITGTSSEDISKFKVQMGELFQMSDLGLLTYYLGIEVKQGDSEITLCQAGYARKVLELAGMEACRPCHTPIENRLKLGKTNGGEAVDATLYRSVIGSLRYLVHTRPDIAHAVGFASRFMEAPGARHWSVVKQILCYVQGTLGYGCCYRTGSSTPTLVGYSDSDHAGDVDDRKSTTGIVFFLGGSIITWTSQKKKGCGALILRGRIYRGGWRCVSRHLAEPICSPRCWEWNQ
ncbi:hypothetical protein D1007_60605 [Hordeum vulgare]|nr:hypothetical protein D1007_60605 [Hordeum vulgare]